MALYAIGDLHLSLGMNKPMDVFGPKWANYVERIRENFSKLNDDDVIVIAGDISWGMSLEQSLPDFQFIDALPGRKILLKGNHDYWWASKKKMDDFFTAHGFNTLHILHNNHYAFGQYGICGTRGWVSMQGEAADAKILAREVQRLQVSIQSAVDAGLEPIVFLHYPPIYGTSMNYEILEVLHKYQIRKCYYGHVHGKSGHNHAFQGMYEGTEMRMISSDYLQFVPEQIF